MIEDIDLINFFSDPVTKKVLNAIDQRTPGFKKIVNEIKDDMQHRSEYIIRKENGTL